MEIRMNDDKANALTSVQTDSLVFTLRIRCGCEGGGKGALIQTDKSGTLSCNNDQTLIIINDQGGSVMSIEKTDISPTLRSESHQHEPVICMAFDNYNLSVSENEPSIGTNCGMSTGRNQVICMATQQGGQK